MFSFFSFAVGSVQTEAVATSSRPCDMRWWRDSVMVLARMSAIRIAPNVGAMTVFHSFQLRQGAEAFHTREISCQLVSPKFDTMVSP